MRRASFVLFLLLGSCSLVGFGCKPREQIVATGPGGITFSAPRAPAAPYISKKKAEDAPAKEVVELRQVLQNLERAKSYHSRIRTPLSNGNIVAELLFSRTGGLEGTLQTGDGLTSQLFVKGEMVYVRYATGTWENVSSSEEAQATRKQIYDNFFVNENGTSSILLRDSAKVTSVKNDPAGCKLYSLEQTFFQPETITQKLEICVKDAYPVRIKNTFPDGAMEIAYDRFDDASILAESPVK